MNESERAEEISRSGGWKDGKIDSKGNKPPTKGGREVRGKATCGLKFLRNKPPRRKVVHPRTGRTKTK